MYQARVIDIHRYYRTGGVDWAKLKANFDAVIIQAGVGTWANALLQEQVDGAIANGVPYATYFIPDVQDGSMQSQMEFYLGLPGVRNARKCLDIEPPYKGARCITNNESLACLHYLENASGESLLVYSNPDIISSWLKNPDWLLQYYLWLGQYYYEFGFPKYLKYTGFDTFLAKWAWSFPKFVDGKKYQGKTVLWQLTDKGKARELCANVVTGDPVYPGGMKDADLSVSTIDASLFLGLLGESSALPPVVPSGSSLFVVVADAVNIRSGPGTGYPTLGSLAKDTKGKILETGGADTWYRIGEREWIASYVNGKRYSKMV